MKTMFKTLLIFFLAGLWCFHAKAQFLGGFFSQQLQQRKIMVAQIAQYELYLGALKTAYHVSETGLNTAHDLKNGTFHLHNAYLSSLEQVNPLIRNSPKGKAIADLNSQTLKLFADEADWQRQQKLLTTTEMTYLQKVRDNLAAKCQLDMDELLLVLTPGKLQLTDAQRLERLDKIYDRMKDKYAFAGSFTAQCRKLALNRKQHRQDNDQLKKLYGIQ
ncbi:hypothetical protein HQ865_24770 [Mucilaginibacter mali]|uniref:TerB family tellurite resistance protein n=1 Tax=Mucilaginibacter mali TaxID=2740462 RepID=A0A7D4QIR0_9SPHI|nr:hypothetical protein [Mucilaginibacter mali]QKJ32832.1 hypothetical protein HQ865_24770 [Mucilaginibacter mali]